MRRLIRWFVPWLPFYRNRLYHHTNKTVFHNSDGILIGASVKWPFATTLSTRVLRIVAKSQLTKVKNESSTPGYCHLHIPAPFLFCVLHHSLMSHALKVLPLEFQNKFTNPSLFTFVNWPFGTIVSTHALGMVAKGNFDKVKNKGLSSGHCHLCTPALFQFHAQRH